MNRTLRQLVVVGLAGGALLVASCGQKSGVHVSGGLAAGASTGGGGLGSGSSGVSGSSGTSGATGSGAAGGSGAAAGSTGSSGSSGASGAAGGASGGSGAVAGGTAGGTSGGAAGGAAGGDTTGVTAGTITIGIHAPVTGAAPFPAASFSNGKAVYFNYINAMGGIFGRKVNVVFEDDGYNPTQARAVCQKMVEQDHVFMLIGGGGADQIVACAQYAASVGVPYEAEGVATTPLAPLPNYFALSETYAQQGPVLVQYIKNVLHKTKVAMVRADTANFDDGHTAFINAAKAAGLHVVADLTIPKDANQGDAQSAAAQLCPAHPEVIYPLMAPTVWVNVAAAVHAQADCSQPTSPPRWAGVGITMGLNQVAQIVCATGAIPGGASFFSPFPELDAANAVDPAYQQAYQAQNHSAGDDIGFALWGADKLIAAQLKMAGPNLTRQGFLNAISGHSFATGVYPTVNYANTRFGGSAVQVLLADCSKQVYVTQFQNKSGF